MLKGVGTRARMALVFAVLVAAAGASLYRAEAASRSGRTAATNVRWHGGPVERHPRVHLILWGPRWTTRAAYKAAAADVTRTVSALRGSSYQRLLTQYYDRAGHVTGDVRLAGVWHDRTTPREQFTGSNRGVRDAAAEIAHAIAVNHWRNSLDAQYLLLLQSPERFGYCARDVNRSLAGRTYVFAIVPWLGPRGSGCGGNSLAEAYGSTVSHEYAEMVTDPLANAWARGSPAGHNNEIADLCNSDAKLGSVWVQEVWSNWGHRCAF